MEGAKPSTRQIQEFYDGHAEHVQGKVGVNIRHRSIMRRLRRAGLGRAHHVLEIGCGTGTLTSLLAKRVTSGSIHAVDISEQAVRMARKRFAGNAAVTVEVNDMSAFAVHKRFDLIVLPDVLEHIPEEQHAALFATLAAHLAPSGVVCIHIPDPFALDWLRKERPEVLQIVDQSLAIAPMVERFAAHGLLLDRFERYGLWTKEPDYNWIEFRRAPVPITQTKWPYFRAVCNELLSRIGVV
jgi:2-polyprenyl-3-methyl-5-hydroxy-6-metoxy-1,4-benzoquinol methylase